jgi:hypothetical protein
MRRVRLFLISMVVASSTPALAQDVSADFQCLFLSNAFIGQAKDPKVQGVARMTANFYAGRLSRVPASQVRAAAAAQKPVTSATAGALMNSCAQNVDKYLQSLQAAWQTPKGSN